MFQSPPKFQLQVQHYVEKKRQNNEDYRAIINKKYRYQIKVEYWINVIIKKKWE